MTTENKIAFLLQGNKTDWDSSVRKRCNVEDDTIDVSRTSSCVKKVKSISCFSVALHDITKKVRWQAEEKGLILHTAGRKVVEFFATLQKNAVVHKAVRHTDRTTTTKNQHQKLLKTTPSGGNAGGLERILEMCICLFSSLEICYWQDISLWLTHSYFLKELFTI